MKNKKHLKKILVFLVVIILFGVGIYINIYEEDSNKNEDDPIFIDNNPKVSYDIVIEIKGEIKRPGIYFVSEDSRIYDVINLAGGLTTNADVSELNMAALISDGMTILVKKRNNETEDTSQKKISINKGTYEELLMIPNIGPSKAEAIISYRSINGLFTNLEDLMNVSGISTTIYNAIKEYICL